MKLPKLPKIEMFGIDIIKNMLFFTTFIIIFLLFLAIFIAPTIKKFKIEKKNYFITKLENENSIKKLQLKSNEYKKLFKKNKKIISALQQNFQKKEFIEYTKKYLLIKSIKKSDETIVNKHFKKTTYIVTAFIDSPVNFYQFIESLKNYKNILKIYFPLLLKSQNGKIVLIFKLEHFKTLK